MGPDVSQALHRPFQDAERTEARRVGERDGLAGAAAVFERFEIADVGSGLPRRLRVGDELVDPVRPEPLGLAAIAGQRTHSRELVDRDLAGDVLLAGPVERALASAVGAVGAEPIRPRA